MGVNAQHALYREDGRWYHVLQRFSGALFDAHGYIVFETECAFRSCPHLSIGEEVNVTHPKGIAAIPGYVRVNASN
jgi:5-methylcytosine-specific restriction enzyme A